MNKPYRLSSSKPNVAGDRMTDQQRIEAAQDWLTVWKLWAHVAQAAASQEAGAALDDFLKQHVPQTFYKVKE